MALHLASDEESCIIEAELPVDGGLDALQTLITLRRPPDVPPQQQPAKHRHHAYRGEGG